MRDFKFDSILELLQDKIEKCQKKIQRVILNDGPKSDLKKCVNELNECKIHIEQRKQFLTNRNESKEIVLGVNRAILLTPYWVSKLLDKRGIEHYFYCEAVNEEDGYRLLKVDELKNSEDKYISQWCRIATLSTRYFGDVINEEEYNKIDEEHSMDIFECFKNREDKLLVEIAKEINDPSIIKIVRIPSDVEYDIIQDDDSLNEIIVEKHRTWD